MAKSLGSDIGGTFTDFALADDATGEVRIHKCLTTPSDPSDAVAEGVKALGADALEGLAYHIHGTTLVINAVIERKGAKTGLITSLGARDVLEIGREKRYDGYDLKISFPEPLVARPTGDFVFSAPSSMLFAPAVTVPLLAVGGLPVGVQVMGQRGEDARVTAIARWLLNTVGPVAV